MNMKIIKALYYFMMACIFIPHIILLIVKRNKTLEIEIFSWGKKLSIPHKNLYIIFLRLIVLCKEFRSVFYFRIGKISILVRWYSPGITNLFIIGNITPPLWIIHGHSTYIHPQRMGQRCQVWHNVTIGKKEQGKDKLQPIIGNDVSICTGAIVLGNITIGNNVTIGAGAIVIKDIPDNCVVAGNPAKIIKQL